MKEDFTINYYDYDLPKSFIAQTPIEKRTHSKLMILDKKTGKIKHTKFYKIINYLNPHDVLVLNNTKVIPARLYGYKENTQAKIEILLLKNIIGNKWEVIARNARRLKV
ncbi:MAG TPA: S-adenosylmethionine:tRNA ribosyltransferase-isomerase, partial [Bacilli bacterium]|nr:S-adenosylmethionine:tRNA ribosyltransferase-isomerase [Bacilli bacterium]